MPDFKDRRNDDRELKELFETKLEVLDGRYRYIGLQNEKLEIKLDKVFDVYDSRLRQIESFIHGHDGNKGALLRIKESEEIVKRLNGTVFMSASGDPGLADDVSSIKSERKQRQHVWALMGGAASGFVLWILTKFGNAGWDIVAAKWKAADTTPAVMVAPHSRKRPHRRSEPVPTPSEESDVQ